LLITISSVSIARVLSQLTTILRRLPRRLGERWHELRGYTDTEKNLFYLIAEIIPAGIANGMVAFNGPFVLRLGGSNTLLSLMVALPALMVILFTIPSGRFMERQANRKPYIIGSIAVARSVFLLIALVPWLVPQSWQAWAVVALTIAQAIALAFFNSGWLALLGDLCPPDRRSTFFSMRWLWLAISLGLASWLSGLWLDWAPFPLNYQVLNFLGFLAAQYSTYLIARPRYPQYPVQPRTTNRAAFAINTQQIKTWLRENRGFAKLNLATLVLLMGVWGAGPLLTLYFVNTLRLPESWLGTNSLLTQLGIMVGALLGARIIKSYGYRRVLLSILPLYWPYALALVLFPHPQAIWGFSFLLVGLDPLFYTTITDALYDHIPAAKRSSFWSAHLTLMNIGAMLTPLLAVQLANSTSLQIALITCAAVRLVGVVLFFVLGIKKTASTRM
jgi:MFS family permease